MMLSLCVAGLHAAAGPAAAPLEEVGRIELFEGDPAGYRLLRGGTTPEPVALLAPLYAGDTLTVEADRKPIRLLVRTDGKDDEQVVVCDRSGPGCSAGPTYTVLSAGKGRGERSALAAWASAIGSWLTEERRRGPVRVEVLRGGTDVPLLAEGVPRIAAGTRAFAVAWRGSRGPCRLDVTRRRAGAPEEVATAIAEEGARDARTASATFRPGPHQLAIRCAGGDGYVGGFEVVERAALPADPDLGGAHLSPEARLALGAAWLATQGWPLEAYLRLSEAGESNALARVLRDRLASGTLPPDPTPDAEPR